MLVVVIDPRQIADMAKPLENIKNGVPRAVAPAINRTLQSGKTAIKRAIRKRYVIKDRDIPIAEHRATYHSLGGYLEVKQGMLDLNKFWVNPSFPASHKPRKLFAQVRVLGGGYLATGFNTSGLPYPGPYIRVSKSRLPIKKLISIGASLMASQPGVSSVAITKMGDTFAKRMDHEIKRVMSSAAQGK